MGYDRNDCWMTCGEKDDRGEATVEDLTKLLDAAWPDGHREMAKAILSKYFVIPISSLPNGER